MNLPGNYSGALRLLLCSALLLCCSASRAEQSIIRVGVYENSPKIFTNSQGTVSGFFPDILAAIAGREGWQLEYVPCEWDNCLRLLEQGELDLMPDVAYSEARSQRFDFHHEVVLSNWTMLYTDNPHSMHSILDLDKKRIAVIADSIQYHVLKRRVKAFDVNPVYIELGSSAQTMQAVVDGQADAALINRLYGLQFGDKYKLEPTHILVEASHLYFAATQNRHTELLSAIDKQIKAMKDDPDSRYHQAMKRWIEPLDQEALPLWLIWSLEGMALLVLLLIITTTILKLLVGKQTKELKKRADALEQSRAMFHALFESSRDAMMISGGDNLIDCNPAMLMMFRYPDRESMRKVDRDDLFPPHQPDGEKSSVAADRLIRQAFEAGEAHFEWIHRRADGTTFPSEVTLIPMHVNNRQLIQATIRDISERKRNEVSLLQLNRALQTLSRVNHILVHAHDEDTLLNDICRAIVENGPYRAAWVGMAQYDDERSVKPVAQYGFEAHYLDDIKINWRNDDFGNGPTGIAIRTGKPSMARDIPNDPNYAPWRERALEQGYASSIALPLISESVIFGALNIYSRYPDAFGERELELLTELAEDLAFGIHTQRLRLDQTDLEEERKGNKIRLQDALLNTINAITVMVEKRDPFTAGHQRRVADLAAAIAGELELSEVQQEGIRFGGMIHDIGNIYVPAEILNRPGKLSESELAIVRSHPSVGYDIVKDIDFPWPVASMILHHHERLDGSGYPDGLSGDEIPLEARIIGVADMVEAMLSHRPYRTSYDTEETLKSLEAGQGTLYDEKVVSACTRLFREKGYTFPV